MLNRYLANALIALMALLSPHLYAATCEFTVEDNWNSGFTSSVRITNDTNETINGWTVALDFAGSAQVTGAWNATVSGNDPYQAVNESYNATIEPGNTVQFGFNAQKTTPNSPAPVPTLGGICGGDTGPTDPPEEPQPPEPVAAVQCDYILQNQWGQGFTATVKITNTSQQVITGWTVSLAFPAGAGIAHSWNTNLSGSNPYLATHKNYNSTIQPGSVIEFGFNGSKSSAGVDVTPVLGGICDPDAEPNRSPVAQATASPQQGTAPLAVSFSGSGSTDPEGDNLSYRWDLGDGTTADTVNVTHTYTTAGAYPVSLTVTDTAGNADTASLTVTVTAPNQSPVAQATASPQQGAAPLAVSFNGGGSTDPDGDNLTYRWDLGDGTIANTATVTHTYTTAGTYSVSLTVTDTAGNTNTVSLTVSVTDPGTDPVTPTALYSLDAARSSLHFVSTKKVHVIETHTFGTLSGSIAADGQAAVSIDLNSVQTGIDIRNERMREHLFETATFTHAEITLNVVMSDITDLAVGESLQRTIIPTVDLHGVSVPLSAEVLITKLTDDTLLVQNISPVVVKAADFDLIDGIEVLRNLANLTVISYSVPTNFTLLFNKQ
jgi:PKD repeat protein